MKRLTTLLFSFSLLMSVAMAQSSNAVIFTENGEKFTIILNGVRQNDQPETNVKITGLNAEFYKLKVIFSNPAVGEKNFNLYLNARTETTYSIRKNSKGEYVIRLVSEVPIAQAVNNSPSQIAVIYHDNPAANAQVGVVTHNTETTAQTIESTNISIDRSPHVNGDDANIKISMSGVNGEEEQAHTTVVHTTTTTTHTFVSHPAPIHPASYLEGYTGPVGCQKPISADEFSDVKESIADKKFEDSRMSVARQALNEHCVFSSQVKELMLLFTFEDNKLEFAKYAYDHTYDIGNYYKVNDAFNFESSIEELNKYLDSRK